VEFDLKIAGAAAVTAFVLSFLIGLISGTTLGMIFIRALVFGIIFFVLGALISVFYQKTLSGDASGKNPASVAPESGGNIDISVGDGDFPEETDDFANDSPENGPDDAESLGLEQNNDSLYNSDGEGIDDTASQVANADGSIDTDMGGFISGMPGIDSPPVKEQEALDSPPDRLGTVEMSLEGKPRRDIQMSDFGRDADGKKIAGAIQIMLKKDEG
jgi:hypothetical protein